MHNKHKQKFQEIEKKFAHDQGLPFQEALPEAEIREAIEENNIQYRHRTLTPFIIIWAFLSQILDEDSSCKKAVKNIKAFFRAKGIRKQLTDSAYCQGRKRLPTPLLSNLALKVAKKQEAAIPAEHLWCGRRVKIVDGSSFNTADTPKNQRAYPQSSSQKPGCGFPIARIVVLFCLATGMIVEMYLAPMTWSERRLFMIHYRDLTPGDVILGDRGFCSYAEIALLMMRDIDCVFRMNATKKVDFTSGRIMGYHDHIVTWEKPTSCPDLLTSEEFRTLPNTLELREIRYWVAIPGFRTQEVTLVTTLLDTQRYAKWNLAELYRLRWSAELFLRDIKITMNMEFINSKTPAMVKNQVWAHVLAYNLIRRIMWQAGELYHIPPLRISFKGTLDTLDVYLPRLASANSRMFCQLYEDFLFTIAHDLIPNRRNRYEPRVIKRRKKPTYSYLFYRRSEYRQLLGL